MQLLPSYNKEPKLLLLNFELSICIVLNYNSYIALPYYKAMLLIKLQFIIYMRFYTIAVIVPPDY